jgi:hypothetical protein
MMLAKALAGLLDYDWDPMDQVLQHIFNLTAKCFIHSAL